MKPTIQLRLGQHLTMTPQLQQAIRLLQLSTLDLKQEIQEALESNLMLEALEEGEQPAEKSAEDEPGAKAKDSDDFDAGSEATGEDQPSMEPGAQNERELNTAAESMPDDLAVDTEWDTLYEGMTTGIGGHGASADGEDYLTQHAANEGLRDHLLWQANLSRFGDDDMDIAIALIDSVSDDGYLEATLEDIQASLPDREVGLDEIEAVLHRLQQFDPPGVCARSLGESLAIQLRHLPEETPHRDAALRLVQDFFDVFASRDQALILRRLKFSEEELSAVNALILTLNPRPGSSVSSSEANYIEPDVFVKKVNGRWRVELNPDIAPRLRINADYASLIRRADSSADNTTLKDHLQEARWFIKSLQSRNDTLLRVARKIVELQRDYFDYGAEAMKPMVLRDIAEALELHESTVSRVTTQKYMYTPRGTLEFKYFFSSHVNTSSGGEASATAIRALIKKLVAAERPDKPLSDNRISTILADQGIEVARRTVAKYRESMAIPSSNERKRLA